MGAHPLRQALGLLAAGWAALLVQSVAARAVPAGLCPELGLLFVVGLGLCVRAPGGLLLAGAVGYAADLLSGSLFGQQALLFVIAFGVTRAATRHLNFRGVATQAIFVAILSTAHAFGLAGLAWLFGLQPVVDAELVRAVLQHAFVNAAFAPWIGAGVGRLAAALSEEEARRGLRLAPRSPA